MLTPKKPTPNLTIKRTLIFVTRTASAAGVAFLTLPATGQNLPFATFSKKENRIALAQDVKIKPLPRAVIPTELPVGVIGSYSPAHWGPCYLAKRNPTLLWMFPLVVGQQRDEVVSIPQTIGGKTRFKTTLVTLLRRGFGLAPLRADSSKRESFGKSTVVEADASGILTSFDCNFAAAPLTYDVSLAKDEKGFPIPADEWGAGGARVSWTPAFVEPDVDGLLIQVSITNQSKKTERYFVDLFGGLETIQRAFGAKNPDFKLSNEARSITFSNSASPQTFALIASSEGSPIRAYELSEACFSSEGNLTTKDLKGNVLPGGGFDTIKPKPERLCALTRISDINVDPGETRVFHLCVGIASNSEKALESAQILLSQAEKFASERQGVSPLFTEAKKKHDLAKYRSENPSLEKLMAQSLINTPFSDGQRVGIPNRQFDSVNPQGAYQSGKGGWLALGWAGYRPDFSAAQLIPWFLSSQAPAPTPPIDLFALWELFQRTHNRDVLENFYPKAVSRYKELLSACRVSKNSWLCAWSDGSRATLSESVNGRRYSPDCSAYLIRSAKILRAAAQILGRPSAEIEAFQSQITSLSKTMNATLWNPELNRFTSTPIESSASAVVKESDKKSESQDFSLSCLTPLIAGSSSLTELQLNSIVKSINDPMFRSPSGLRSRSKAASEYLSNSAVKGGISFGDQWILWKGLLDRGESEVARQLASDILIAYRVAQTKSNGFPELLDGDTGDPLGRLDSSGDACSLMPMYDAYNTPGTVSSGWDVCILDSTFDKTNDSLRVLYRQLEASCPTTLLCVMGKPGASYTVNGGIKGVFKADSTGALALPVSNDATNQQINILPTGAP